MLLLETPGLSSSLQLRPPDFLCPVLEQVGSSVFPDHFVLKSFIFFIHFHAVATSNILILLFSWIG